MDDNLEEASTSLEGGIHQRSYWGKKGLLEDDVENDISGCDSNLEQYK